MIHIRPAADRRPGAERDRKAILNLISLDIGLQQDNIPSNSEFYVVEIDGEVSCCCALMEYSKKLAEIRSFAFAGAELKRLYGEILIGECIKRARRRKIRQLLATISKIEQELFARLGFGPFSKDNKYAMLKSLVGANPTQPVQIPGVRIVQARTEFHWEGIKRLARMFPDSLIQPGHPLFPTRNKFDVAVADEQVVGMTALTVFKRRGAAPRRAEIRSVAVDPDPKYRNHRIGQQLVRHRENLAIKLGLTELFTVTPKKDWFEKLGYSNVVGSEQAWFMELDQAA